VEATNYQLRLQARNVLTFSNVSFQLAFQLKTALERHRGKLLVQTKNQISLRRFKTSCFPPFGTRALEKGACIAPEIKYFPPVLLLDSPDPLYCARDGGHHTGPPPAAHSGGDEMAKKVFFPPPIAILDKSLHIPPLKNIKIPE